MSGNGEGLLKSIHESSSKSKSRPGINFFLSSLGRREQEGKHSSLRNNSPHGNSSLNMYSLGGAQSMLTSSLERNDQEEVQLVENCREWGESSGRSVGEPMLSTS
mmetsp:Transcript_31517/g.54426  ORF Transcript_31517/g.54426 Transcript_31517/m.54426 type:complete len:105 (-) Transcript_31517:227-541(-)